MYALLELDVTYQNGPLAPSIDLPRAVSAMEEPREHSRGRTLCFTRERARTCVYLWLYEASECALMSPQSRRLARLSQALAENRRSDLVARPSVRRNALRNARINNTPTHRLLLRGLDGHWHSSRSLEMELRG